MATTTSGEQTNPTQHSPSTIRGAFKDAGGIAMGSISANAAQAGPRALNLANTPNNAVSVPDSTASRGTEPSPSTAGKGSATTNGNVSTGPASAFPTSATGSASRMDMRQANGATKDGRVRNPIPSKLKGKTDQKKGNFNVMHMDISNRGESQARYDAAKRNSENTALQAKLAETDHYVSHHRRANYVRPKLVKQNPSSPTGVAQPGPAPVAVAPPAAAPMATPPAAAPRSTAPPIPPPPSVASTPVQPPRLPPPRPALPLPQYSLTPQETKTEQARLLTLLRTLPHATIVDQICKALAFFGGTPDAPPPADGNFPPSNESNGSGSLFIGWIAEIFPDLSRPPRPPPVITLAAPPRRPRGRPKGSKAQKPRRDKGIRKGAHPGGLGRVSAIQHGSEQDGQDESWVDVDDGALETDEVGDFVDRRVLNLLSTPPRGPEVGAVNATPATGSTAGFTSINNATGETASAIKKRGRPKGSKNRPKDGASSQEAPQQTQPQPQTQPQMLTQTQPQAQMQMLTQTQPQAQVPTQPVVSNIPVPPPAVAAISAPTVDGQPKKKAASQGKSGKNKKKQDSDATSQVATTQPSPIPRPQTSTSYIPPPKFPPSAIASTVSNTQSPAINGDSASSNKRTQLPAQSVLPPAQGFSATPTPAPQVKESTISGVKRKRQSNKNTATTANGDALSGSAPATATSSSSQQLPQPTPVMNTAIPVAQQSQPTDLSGDPNNASVPPAKRPRKSTASSTKRQSVTNAAASNAASAAAASLELTQQAAHPTQAVQNPAPAGGLDAHLERIQAIQSRNDQSQSYANRQQKHQQQITNPTRQTGSSMPAEGLDAHYERFTNVQNRQPNANANTRQPTKQHPQQTTQSASPTPPQAAKAPQMANSLSQQQSRVAPNYYAQNQTPSYTTQQAAYGAAQRQQHSMSPSAPGAGLVSHVTHSPQFGAQNSNSPLMGTENSFRSSPQLGVHSTSSFAPRRTPSASPMENPYRQPATGAHQSPHFASAGRQTPSANSHTGVASSFQSFSSDPSFLDIQGISEANSGHGSIGLSNSGTYDLGGGHARTNSGSSASLYGTAAGMANGTNMGANFRGQQNRW